MVAYQRAVLFQDVPASRWHGLHPCTRQAGIFLQDGDTVEAWKRDVVFAPATTPTDDMIAAWPDRTPNDRSTELYSRGRLLVGMDGSGILPDWPLLARGGRGLYFGDQHAWNQSLPNDGLRQSAQAGEVGTLALALKIVKVRDDLGEVTGITDSRNNYKIFNKLTQATSDTEREAIITDLDYQAEWRSIATDALAVGERFELD